MLYKLFVNNKTIYKLIENHKIPKGLVNLYLRYQEIFLVGLNKKALKNITNNIEAVNKALKSENYYMYRFPIFIENWQHLSISFKDILINQNIHLLAEDQNEKNLTARTLALLLYEFLEDFQKFNNKAFRIELLTSPNPELIIKAYDELKNVYKVIKNEFWQKLGDIRHQTIAHKNKKDVRLLFDSIEKIDVLDIKGAFTFIHILYASYEGFRIHFTKHIEFYKDEIAKIPYPARKKLNS